MVLAIIMTTTDKIIAIMMLIKNKPIAAKYAKAMFVGRTADVIKKPPIENKMDDTINTDKA